MRCAACHAVNPDNHRFCSHCGAALAPTAPAPAQRGELKLATIFFADIAGSTAHIANLDPEQAMEQLQPAVQRMCDAVEAFGGTVVRTLGDGILALFGVPHTLEGHARLACEAALALQQAFEGNQLGLQVRVGLHSGQVASDPQAVDSALGGGVHGRAIHLASRVVGVAEPGGICLSAACLALTGGACEARSLGAHTLKGIAEPTELHALVRMQSDAPDHHFHRAALSPLQGRAGELAALKNALQRTEQGQCAVIGLAGAAGTGKSRLCFEFVQWCRSRLVSVTEVRAQLYGYATPLAPVLALLRDWFFHITRADDAAAARGRIAARLSRMGVAGDDDLALFHEFLGVADSAAAPCALAPKARRARLLALFGDMVRHSGATASVIVLEDLHWLDEASAEFLDVLVRSVAGTRTLLLFNYRPSYKAPWPALAHFHEIHLAELGAADAEALVRQLVGAQPQWQGLMAAIVQRSAGNPFFAEELVRALQEDGDPADASGLASRLHALPATVQAVIGARIDRLGATQKTVLHICAVIGKEIPLPVLQRVALYLAGQIEHELDSLCEAELLELLREIVNERRFGFHHPLIQEVAYNSQLRARRASLHAAVARAMEAHYSAEPDEYAALMAFHYEAAGQPVPAARHLARAAQWLGATHSTLAMKHWRHARELLRDQPRAPDTDRLRVQVGGGLLQLGWREGLDAAELNQVVDEAVAHASEADRGQVQLILVTQGRILHGNGGSADDYVNTVRRAIELGSANPGRAALLQVTLSQAYSWAGLSHEALAASDQAVPGIAAVDAAERAALGFDPERWRLALRARVLMRMLRLDEAEDCLRRMEQISADSEDPVINQIAFHCKIEIAWCRRDADEAQRYAQASADAVRAGSNPYLRATGKWFDGTAALLARDLVRANRSFAEALELIRTTRVAVDIEDELLAWSAECRALAGDTRGALDQAKQAVELARRRCHRIPECRGLIVWGTVLAKEGGDGAKLAGQLFDRAEQLIAETGAATCEDGLRLGRALLASPT